jgi:hypothetical protein
LIRIRPSGAHSFRLARTDERDSPIPRHPDFGFFGELKLRRQDPNDRALLLVDTWIMRTIAPRQAADCLI